MAEVLRWGSSLICPIDADDRNARICQLAGFESGPQEYEEFRKIAAHLQWLSDQRNLFVRTLVFEETLIANFKAVPRAEDINNGFSKGPRWRQKPDGNYELTRLKGARVVVLNYDPMAMSDQQRFELDEKIRKNPSGFVYLDIRPDAPGGNFPIQGAIKLRSMFQILRFLGMGISSVKEFDVTPDTRTGTAPQSPTDTMKINISDTKPDGNVPWVEYGGRYYAVNDTQWDRLSFTILSVLFQTAVGDVEDVGIPITIAK